MSCTSMSIAKLTAVESTDLEEVIEVVIQYHYDQETSPIKLACVKQEININYHYQSFLETIEQGFPECKELLPTHLREFWNMQNNLYVINAPVFKEGCILIQ